MTTQLTLSIRDGAAIDRAEEALAQAIAPIVTCDDECFRWARQSRDRIIQRARDDGYHGRQLAQVAASKLYAEIDRLPV